MIKKATGKRGSWFASVDSEDLPCVHEHWWEKGDGIGRYNDTGLKPGTRKGDKFFEAIKAGCKVILTTDKVIRKGDQILFERDKYVAVWTVSEVEFDEMGLRFNFLDRICDLE